MDSKIKLGAEVLPDNRTQFSVWAPTAKMVEVQIVERDGSEEKVIATHALEPQPGGLHTVSVADCGDGTLYRLSVGGAEGRPDPRSRFQPFGVHGPSQVVDAKSFAWNDRDWQGIKKRDLVIYELHIGSLTEEGDYASAISCFEDWKRLGITAIELLPLAQCPGRWNWGYDGVNYFAPTNNFGTPNQLKQFVDACHQNDFAVIIDVVYNHVGPRRKLPFGVRALWLAPIWNAMGRRVRL